MKKEDGELSSTPQSDQREKLIFSKYHITDQKQDILMMFGI